MFFQENYAHDGFVLILIIFSWLHLLEELACIATVLSDEPCCIPHEEFSALVSELTCRDVCIVTVLVELGEHFFEGACDVVVDTDIVRREEEDVVGERTDPEVEDDMKFVDLFRFFL